MKNKLNSLLAAFVLLIVLTPKPAEAFLKFRTNYFSSPVKGSILYNGEPVVGAQVKRKLIGAGNDPGDRVEDETTTDEKGLFELPEVTNKTYFLRPHIWSAAPGVTQIINLYFNDEKYGIWVNIKEDFNKGTDTRTNASLINLSCDLALDASKEDGNDFYMVNCRNKE